MAPAKAKFQVNTVQPVQSDPSLSHRSEDLTNQNCLSKMRRALYDALFDPEAVHSVSVGTAS